MQLKVKSKSESGSSPKAKMMTGFVRFGLALSIVFNSACVHTRSEETRAVQEIQETNLLRAQMGAAEIHYLLYRSSKFPLSDFFFHLRRGDYAQSFRQLDIRYQPANFQDDVLGELIEAGFVPVYVKIKNTGTAPLNFDEKSFLLDHADGTSKAFYSEHLPREFKELSPKAVAANVYNTGVVVVGFAAVLGLMVIASAANGTPDFSGLGSSGNSSSSDDDNPVYNDIHKNIKVDYKKYLLSKSLLAPGQEARGLLFFNIGDSKLIPRSQLTFREGQGSSSEEGKQPASAAAP